MIDLYSWPTPNGQKVHIMLEETGLSYRAHGVNIGAGEQFAPEFLAISPNNKIPAIVDSDGPGGERLSLFESGAILMYLGDKAGALFPTEPVARWRTTEWLMFQMANIGPMLGQNHHFRRYAPEKIPYAIERYTKEAQRLYGVVDTRLARAEWLAGDAYTIADIACYPWMRGWESKGVELDELPHVTRWMKAMSERPAVQRGLDVLKAEAKDAQIDDQAKRFLFGDAQYERRGH